LAERILTSSATHRFWRLFRELPVETRELATKTYRLWRNDPNHPSLHFRALAGRSNLYTVRVGRHHRALGLMETGANIEWIWIGTHAEYESPKAFLGMRALGGRDALFRPFDIRAAERGLRARA
jgi:hypothetical protein